jgi:hypothetical protein
MENSTKFIARVGNMYVSAVYPSANILSLSKDINDACSIGLGDTCDWVQKETGAKIIEVKTTYKEV